MSLRPIISGRYALAPFREEFRHCGATADLFAQVSANAQGSVRTAVDLLATALNEMLEWACREQRDGGEMLLEVLEDGCRLHLALTLPLNAATDEALLQQLRPLDDDAARALFLERIEAAAGAGSELGLYWLAAEFGSFAGSRSADGRLRLELALRP